MIHRKYTRSERDGSDHQRRSGKALEKEKVLYTEVQRGSPGLELLRRKEK